MSDFARLQELARAAGLQVNPPSVVDVPYASGTGDVGSTLNCTMGNWNGEPASYAYQWMREGMAIETGTSADYTVVADDVGRSLSCVVTATNNVGSTAAPPSNAVAVAAAARKAQPPQAQPAAHDVHSDARRK